MRNPFNQIPYVCKIKGYYNSFACYTGHGVFVSPEHVLTAWHNLSPKAGKAVWISNRRFLQEPLLTAVGENVRVDENIDLALMRLSRPLSRHFARVAHNFDPPEEVTFASGGYRFLKTSKGRYLKPNYSRRPDENGVRLFSDFEYAAKPRKGMSGSPILNSKGEIVSIHHGRDAQTERIRHFLPPIGNSMGVTPEKLFEFFKPYRKHVESCCPDI